MSVRWISFLFFLLLAVVSVSSQTTQLSEPRDIAVKVDSFGRLPNGHIRAVLDSFLAEIAERGKGTRGLVVNYGTVREVELRRRLVANHLYLRNFPDVITIVRGGNVSELRSDVWLVPSGAHQPAIEPEAFIVSEFGRVTRSNAIRKARSFHSEAEKFPSHQAYVILYGTEAEMKRIEAWIINSKNTRSHGPVMTLVRGGRRAGGTRTVMWLVPPGAANPAP